ncbi:zinc ribbon domain-containing protein [Fictibacillus sp. B-59209]|uniref:zinc ribbon domain-containing protein n=1 Tax=Fictibacillus sp. B-59209 TaxID=3024873 RepID=UPI002E1FC0C3|nr:zinc ribbon domain-containing protein [Fictibacillus sp. B-59209]
MSDLQAKLGDGLTKIQGSLQQGKQKLHTAQEVGQLRKTGAEASAKRLELIVGLGEEVYSLIRKGEFVPAHLSRMAEEIQVQDTAIFQVNRTIEELNRKNTDGGYSCSCGAPVSSADKFCGSCGKPVVIPNQNSEQYTLQCRTCSEMIPSGSEYCGCCGNKTV